MGLLASQLSHPSTSLQRATTVVSSILGNSCADGHFSQASLSAHEGADRELESYLHLHLHLYLLNRGVLITPFHNMVLMSPASTTDDVTLHDRPFAAVDELFAPDES